ncbi:MAG: hypothetical protein AAF694_21685 [Bacteroidota bacterium]
MSQKTLIWIAIGWGILTLFNYYYMNFFFLAFEWIFLCLGLFIGFLIQLAKLAMGPPNPGHLRIQKTGLFLILFVLTFFQSWPNSIIEKLDWLILENRRNEIVNQVKRGELNPNVSWNGIICELPFEFPVVSNGGNDIVIWRNEERNTVTIEFWIFRNFFEAPQKQFVYTNDPTKIQKIEEKIKKDRFKNNWKIKENWYRTYGELWE